MDRWPLVSGISLVPNELLLLSKYHSFPFVALDCDTNCDLQVCYAQFLLVSVMHTIHVDVIAFHLNALPLECHALCIHETYLRTNIIS